MANKTTLVVAGLLIIAAVIYLIISSTSQTANFYMTIAELQEMGEEAIQRNLTISGAVIGDSIDYDPMQPRLTFTIVQIPADLKEIEAAGGLAEVLHKAAHDPDAPRVQVVYQGIQPDLLKDEAQAIVRGYLDPDGTFHADQLLLKCPSRYAADLPEQLED